MLVKLLFILTILTTYSIDLSLAQDNKPDAMIYSLIDITKSHRIAGKSPKDMVGNHLDGRSNCIWLPEIRYSKEGYCNQDNIIIIIDEQLEPIRSRMMLLPIYAVEEGCAYLTRGLNKEWEKCVATDIKSIYYIVRSIHLVSKSNFKKCINGSQDSSNDISYQLRYNTIAKCLSRFLKIGNTAHVQRLKTHTLAKFR